MLTLPVGAVTVDLGRDAVCSLRRVAGAVPICDRPAAWAVRLACCGNVKVVCEPHRDIAASVAPRVFVCLACRAKSPPVASRWPI